MLRAKRRHRDVGAIVQLVLRNNQTYTSCHGYRSVATLLRVALGAKGAIGCEVRIVFWILDDAM
jgi:hypothetical protein